MRLQPRLYLGLPFMLALIVGIPIRAKSIPLVVDNQLSTVSTILQRDRVMIPIRYVSESMGAAVEWNSNTKIITIKSPANEFALNVSNYEAFINGQQTTIDETPFIKEGTTYVPLRFISEGLGLLVDWDSLNSVVYISSPVDTDKPSLPEDVERVLEFGDFIIPVFAGSSYWDDSLVSNNEKLEFVQQPFGLKIYNRPSVSSDANSSLQFIISPKADVEKSLAVIKGVLEQKIKSVKVEQVLEAIKIINTMSLGSSDAGIITAGKYQVLVSTSGNSPGVFEDPISVVINVLYSIATETETEVH